MSNLPKTDDADERNGQALERRRSEWFNMQLSKARKGLRWRILIAVLLALIATLALFFQEDLTDVLRFFDIDLFSTRRALIVAASSILYAAAFLVFFAVNLLSYGKPYVTEASLHHLMTQPDNKLGPEMDKQNLMNQRDGVPSSILERQLSASIARLQQEISRLGGRATLNLIIGIFASLSGIVALSFIIYVETVSPFQGDRFLELAHYTMRLSLALLIEIFAYFFLRVYRANIDDIKYYQNEITNVESRWMALHTALEAGDPGLLKGILDSLGKTERNFILHKGETTVGLERDRMEKNELVDLLRDAMAVAARDRSRNKWLSRAS